MATNMYYGDFDKDGNPTVSTRQRKEIAVDFLKQTQPVITTMLDRYLTRFYKNNDHSYRENILPRQIEDFLIKDFLRQ
jgi:hypothetical protein